MQADHQTVQALSSALISTVSPDSATRKNAESQLRQGEQQPGFLLVVMEIVRSDSSDAVVRQAGALYFKNAVKKLWADEEVCSCPED